MQRRSPSHQTSTRIISISGITVVAILAAILLPLLVAAPILLIALFTMRLIAEVEQVVEPAVIRREYRR